MRYFLPVIVLLLVVSGCYQMRKSKGGGEGNNPENRMLNSADIALHPGYEIQLVAKDLTFPTAIAFDENNTPYVIEAGYSYGEVWEVPKLIQIGNNGEKKVIASGEKNGPWTGIDFHDGNFYVAEGGQADGGKILKISKQGKISTIVENLPSVGDHHTNGPVIKDGYIYFGQGTATNSAVVGTDNAEFGWLMRKKDFHDIPCKDVTLNGENFTTPNPLTPETDDQATTGAYSPFGVSTQSGQVIRGSLPCTGSVMRVPINGGSIELVAWGLRNPFGLCFSQDGKLYVTENAYDDRGSRPVWGTGDVLWEIKDGLWYGWPDYSAGKSLIDGDEFKVPGKKDIIPLLKEIPNEPPKPAAILSVHSSSNGFDFSTNAEFGYPGEAFIAQFGDMASNVGKVLAPVGFKVIRVDVKSGVIRDFIVNKGKRNGPASLLGKGGLERPVSVKFNNAGDEMYIVDFGILNISPEKTDSRVKTGVIWKVTKKK